MLSAPDYKNELLAVGGLDYQLFRRYTTAAAAMLALATSSLLWYTLIPAFFKWLGELLGKLVQSVRLRWNIEKGRLTRS
jgi:hypothetical protein